MAGSMDDAALVARTRAGDTTAFDSLVERHVQQLRMYLGPRCRSQVVVDEISQETWVHAYAGLHTYDSNRPFLPWLMGIARNQLADRARRKDPLTLDADALDTFVDRTLMTAAATADTDERLRSLDDCLAHMNQRGRDMLIRHHGEGWPLKRLAQAYKLPAKRLASQLLRLRRSLRNCLESQA